LRASGSLVCCAAWLAATLGLHAAGPACQGVSAAPSSSLTTVRIASGFLRPLLVTAAPGDPDRLFVVEQDGRIRLLKNGLPSAAPFLDIASLTRSPANNGGSEEGLLGLAFHPDYAVNGRFFVYQTDTSGLFNLVVAYRRDADQMDVADPTSREVILAIDHPDFSNHNGGMLAFGPSDGLLYVATGDGGDGCDPRGNAQDLGSLLGKILRIDVGAFPYAIPGDNPFVGVAGARPEIWAYGLRNPFRFAFDPETADLLIGDVGQGVYEEINLLPAGRGGANLGWDAYEGDHCPNPSCLPGGPCGIPDYVPPVLEYQQGQSECAVTGGVTYRGCRMPDLRGTYFYSDFCAAFLRTFRWVDGQRTEDRDRTLEMAPGGGLDIRSVTSFGTDARGEIYVVDRGGEVFRVVPRLAALEVSGTGAVPFVPGGAAWTWENLIASSGHPVAAYRVYRRDAPGAEFVCVHRTENPAWDGGDPAVPTAGVLFAYVVTAESVLGEESSPGAGSASAPRPLSPLACP
jgi:hypothetical protein